MNNIRRFLFTILLFFTATMAYGQESLMINCTINDGLPSNNVLMLNIEKHFWVMWGLIALSIIVIAAITVVAIRRRMSNILREKEKVHEAEVKFMKSEYKALNALMNPHFIFNTLNNVQSLFNENDKIAGNAYLKTFADLICQNMHNVSKELISLQKEMELVNNYLLLEKLRFEDKLNYSVDIDEDIDLSEILVPPLLVQPIVENSIKRGILPLNSSDGFIFISVFEKDNYLHIEVKDNGIGVNTLHNGVSSPESFGMSGIKKRIEQLNIIQNKKIIFSVHEIAGDSGKVEGTIATIKIPIAG